MYLECLENLLVSLLVDLTFIEEFEYFLLADLLIVNLLASVALHPTRQLPYVGDESLVLLVRRPNLRSILCLIAQSSVFQGGITKNEKLFTNLAKTFN